MPALRSAGIVALVVAALVVVASACGATRTLDRVGLEAQIADWMFPNHPELVDDVQCPVIDDPEPGDRFACSAAVGDQIVALSAALVAGPTQPDGSPAPELRVELTSDARFVAADDLAQLLGRRFSAEVGVATSVDCGQPIVVVERDQPLECVAIDASGVARTFDVTVADDGSFGFSLR